jgi:SRSO17 transposase
MQHLLSRARVDDRQLLDAAADWAAEHITAGQDEDDVVLIVDETADEKSSADCAGAARQYSGTVGGIAMCQVAVTLTCASPAGHALIGRALYLPADWAADEERRELAGVPDEVMFATKPQLAGDLLQHARDRGIRAGFTVGDEVYGGLDLRRSIRKRGTGYVMAVRSNYMVTLSSGRRLTVKTAASLVKPGMWQRMRTGSATKGAKDYHWAMIEITPDDTPQGQDPRARRAAAAPAPLHRHRQQLPVLDTEPGAAGEADQGGRHQVENRGRSPAGQAGRRAGQRPGHHLDLLAPLDRAQPARRRVPRRGRRPAARRRQQRRRPRTDSRHRA